MPLISALLLAALLLLGACASRTAGMDINDKHQPDSSIEIGPRPALLVADMDQSPLKDKLQACAGNDSYRTDFSIAHRGAALRFPEHTEESYRAAARMGAGIIECDVTFTKDRELVCRHSQCDLHTTTNILDTPLAAKCTKAGAQCCTSDITLAEFKTLNGKMDDASRAGSFSARGKLLSHKESIELFKSLGVKMTPDLKAASVPMPFEGQYTQEQYAQQMIAEYRAAGVPAEDVWAQSFDLDDLKYWLANEPAYGAQAVFLDGRYGTTPPLDSQNPETFKPSMQELAADGIKIIGAPIFMLLALDTNGKMISSEYALQARQAGLGIIAWTLERSGPLSNGGGFYYQSVTEAINNDGDMLTALHVLAEQVGVLGVFSDWPATTTFYANCMNLH